MVYYRVVDRAVRAANRRIRLQCSLASAADLRAAADSGLRETVWQPTRDGLNRRVERLEEPFDERIEVVLLQEFNHDRRM